MVVIIATLIFKYQGLPYPPAIWELEITQIFLFAGIQFIKLDIGHKGNKTETYGTLRVFLFMSVFSCFCFIFYLCLQTYVLVLEIILNSVGLFFCVMEFGAAFIRMCVFMRIDS